jgi:hypothetical protein
VRDQQIRVPEPMNCDLERLYGDVVAQLPVGEDDDSFLFTRDVLPQPPERLATDRLVIKRGRVQVESDHRLDQLILLAEPPALRLLGVFILAVLFHPVPGTAELALVHPKSQVKRVRVRFEHPTLETVSGYWAAPTAFGYWADSPFPLLCEANPQSRPWFRLTTEDEIGGPYGRDDETWWRERDTIVGFGDDEATIAVATFFLDAAVFPRPRGEYLLEGPIGNGVLDARTANVRVLLPSSESWEALWESTG